ncbi:aminoglycoside phosphotransferase family protein [Kiloniella sp. b19]|uniref:aminoglycoside phosphotransferase family protein n=1 Tax=Kiloniella sp. GXU_MW_B19 TaxID=3141326 RepID=UPI0031D00B70
MTSRKENTMGNREEARLAFARKYDWGNVQVHALPADASARRYYRLEKPDGQSALIMDAPPEKEDVKPFVKVADHLCAQGFSAPRVLARDMEQGFLLLEDFGEGTYTRLLKNGHDEVALYRLATLCLAELHAKDNSAEIEVPPYDRTVLIREALLLADWHFPAVRGDIMPDALRQSYVSAWCSVFDSLKPQQPQLVLRDFHVDNLMLLSGRDGVEACGLLDFQDALIGTAAYDVVSLLEDARRDIEPALIEEMLESYIGFFERQEPSSDSVIPFDPSAFMAWYRSYGVQRHCKVAGIFVRLAVRDGRDHYPVHIPRVVRLLERGLADPVLLPVKAWFDTHYSDFQNDPVLSDRGRILELAQKSEERGVMI